MAGTLARRASVPCACTLARTLLESRTSQNTPRGFLRIYSLRTHFITRIYKLIPHLDLET